MRKQNNLTVSNKRPAEAFFRREHERFERRFDDWPAEILDVATVEASETEVVNPITGGLEQDDVPACTPGGGVVIEEELTLLGGEYTPTQTPDYYLSVYANGVALRSGVDYNLCSGSNICVTVGGSPVVLARYVV